LDRTAKVAKTGYADHGDHHHHKTPSRKDNVLRKMTMDATDLFKLWQADATPTASRRSKKRSSPKNENNKRSNESKKGGDPNSSAPASDLSPHRFAFSQLALDSSGIPQSSSSRHPHDQLPANLLGLSPNGTGLSAVIENSSLASSQSTRPNSRNESSVKSRDSSIPSKSSVPSLRTLPRGKCLTQPSESAANNGLDNAEGNLIAHENDAISVSRTQIHVLTKDKMNVKRADFRIQCLLGQGTFAQVFQCVHVQTGNVVAIKIVKNKPAYTRQAAVEIDVFRALVKGHNEKPLPSSSQSHNLSTSPSGNSVDASVTSKSGGNKWDHMVDLVCYFMHQNHLCLVFELLGLNLYEVLKKRQFRGLPLSVVRTLVKQAVIGVKELSKKNIVHCDLKPENILLVNDDDGGSVVSAGERRRNASSAKTVTSASFEKKGYGQSSEKTQGMEEPPMSASGLHKMTNGGPTNRPNMTDVVSQSPANSMGTTGTVGTNGQSLAGQQIKLIDFGSACFEGQTSHTYIQSRFYRSPEVLVGLPYDSAIDMWSLGCVAAELFLGLPILPGVHEHDQLSRICEMISRPSDWMLDQGSKGSKFFVKYVPREGATFQPDGQGGRSTPKMLPQWRVRTQQEYIASLSPSEIKKKGGLAKLEKQPGNRYFKRKRLAEILSHKGQSGSAENKDNLDLFIHFLHGKRICSISVPS
jgi:serine/threonine protein kinase